MRKINRIIIILMVLCILLSSSPMGVLSALIEPEAWEMDGIMALVNAEKYGISRADATDLARVVKSDGTDLYTDTTTPGRYFNAGVYKQYNVICYGPRHGSVSKGEYRYLGYDFNGNDVTNDRYPNDVSDTTPLEDRNWIAVDGAEKSWENLSDDQVDRILNKNPIKNDGNLIYTSISNILQKVAQSETEKKKRALVLTPVKLCSDGTVKSVRIIYPSGQKLYNTFTIPKFSNNPPKVKVTPETSSIVMQPDQQSVTINVKVEADYTGVTIPTGRTASDITKSALFKFEGSSKWGTDQSASLQPSYATFQKTFSRSNLKPGLNTVPLDGNCTLTTIYDEQFKDIKGTASLTIDVRSIDPDIVPGINVTPEKKQTDGSKDETLTTDVSAKLFNYTNAANVKQWSLWAVPIVNGSAISPAQNHILAGGKVSTTDRFTFTVPKSLLAANQNLIVDVKFTAQAIFISPVQTSGGSVTFFEKSTYGKSEFYKQEAISEPDPEDPPTEGNIPPVAVLDVPEEAKAGEDIMANGSGSYDEDGEIVKYTFETPRTAGVTVEEEQATIWYDEVGTYKLQLVVTDDKGARGRDAKVITITEPTPDARMKVSGSLKENRKISLVSTSRSPEHYPLDDTLTKWTLTPVSGCTLEDIRYSGPLTGVSSLDMLVKKTGVIDVNLEVTNSLGLKDSVTKRITVVPDQAPTADYGLVTTLLRDPADSSQATVVINDSSFSPDNDVIASRVWKYSYDSNNNGLFTDEAWVTFDSGNNAKTQFKTSQVGKYKVELNIKEGFGQETIPAFITDSDYRTANTGSKVESEKVTEIINIAPVTDFTSVKKKKADIALSVWDTRYSENDVLAAANSILVPKLVANNIDYTLRVKDDYEFQYGTTDVPSGNFVSGTPSKTSGAYRLGPTPYIFPAGYTNHTYTTTRYTGSDRYSIIPNPTSGSAGVSLRVTDGTNTITLVTMWCSETNIGLNTGTINEARYGESSKYRANGELNLYRLEITGNTLRIVASVQMQYPPVGPGSLANFGADINETYDISQLNKDNLKVEVWYSSKRGSQSTSTSGGLSAFWQGTIQSVADRCTYLDKVIEGTNFREGSKRYVGVISDKLHDEMTSDVRRANLTAKFISNSVNFKGLGNGTNKSQFESFIQGIDGKGTYIDNGSLTTAIDSFATQIVNEVNNEQNMRYNYILLNEEIDIATYYSDFEKDMKNAERWLYSHDPYYFDNNNGQIPNSGVFRSSPITKFDKVGKYEITLQAQDNPKNAAAFSNYWLWSAESQNKMYLYVHRKPIAQFTASAVLNSVTGSYITSISESSYDLDHTSRADKGIAVKKWQYREAGSNVWIDGLLPASLPGNRVYLVKLEVQDLEFQWSDPNVQIVSTNSGNLPPVAQFTAVPNPLPINLPLQVTDSSFDPNGDPITVRTWTVVKGGSQVYTGASCPTDFSPYGLGDYEITLVVEDDKGSVSEPYTQGLTVIPNIPPNIDADPASRGWNNTDVKVRITALPGSHPLQQVKYCWSTSQAKPSSGWQTTANTSFEVTRSESGRHYLHMEAFDITGGSFYRCRGLYDIDKLSPSADIRGEVVPLNVTADITARDSLSGVKTVSYKWAQTVEKPSSGWTTANIAQPGTASYDATAQISTVGIWYLHVQVSDHANNVFWTWGGPYTVEEPIKAYDFTITRLLDVDWRGYYFDLANPVNGDGKRYGYNPRQDTDIKTSQMPVNYLAQVAYPKDSVKAGYKMKGYIRVDGEPDSVGLTAKYRVKSVLKYDNISTLPADSNKFTFEWIIPQTVDNATFVEFSVNMVKSGTSYGDDKWTDSWPEENLTRAVLYIKGTVLDDIKFNQSH